jgi:hypothetical protein
MLAQQVKSLLEATLDPTSQIGVSCSQSHDISDVFRKTISDQVD